jgi:Tol biopolymer transport system component
LAATGPGTTLVNVVTGEERLLENTGGWPQWSPDGALIASATSDAIQLMTPDGKSRRLVAETTYNTRFAPSWSPNGQRLTFHADDDEAYVVNVDGTGLINLTQGPPKAFVPVWSPDGAWIAFSYLGGGLNPAPELNGVFVVRPDGTDLRKLAPDSDSNLSWSPDGRSLAFGGSGGAVHIVDVVTGSARVLSATANLQSKAPVWAPDGSFLVFHGSCNGTTGSLCRVEADGSAVRLLVPHAAPRRMTFSPD